MAPTAELSDRLTARELAVALLVGELAGPGARELADLVRLRLVALGDVEAASLLSTWLANNSADAQQSTPHAGASLRRH